MSIVMILSCSASSSCKFPLLINMRLPCQSVSPQRRWSYRAMIELMCDVLHKCEWYAGMHDGRHISPCVSLVRDFIHKYNGARSATDSDPGRLTVRSRATKSGSNQRIAPISKGRLESIAVGNCVDRIETRVRILMPPAPLRCSDCYTFTWMIAYSSHLSCFHPCSSSA